MYSDGGFYEVLASAIHPKYTDLVSKVQFNSRYESIWAGTKTGFIYSLRSPTLEPYAFWKAHSSAVLNLIALEDRCLSVSASKLCIHDIGGLPQLSITAPQDVEFMSVCIEPLPGSSRLLAGCRSGAVQWYDRPSGRPADEAQLGQGALPLLQAPVGRGMVAAGTTGGRLCLLDPRNKMKIEHSLVAHQSGLTAMDVRGDLVATCGMTLRGGRLVPENAVHVYDVRGALRPLFSPPFSAGPSMLAFHPNFSTMLVVGSAGGLFCMMDVSTAFAQTYQVDTAGDSLTSCHISSSGECITFGGSGGYVHLFAGSDTPKVNMMSSLLDEPPEVVPAGVVPLKESDSFNRPRQYYCASGKLLSDFNPGLVMEVGQPQHVIDASLLRDIKQVDFVGYINNPHYARGEPYGEATRKVARFRAQRMPLQSQARDPAALKAERAEARAAAGEAVLPTRYKRVTIKVQTSIKFEEFDFSYYNKTCFAGLENDIPNCYCNALLQALYFVPSFRRAVLQHQPEQDTEFCLLCELLFLYRMLMHSNGTPCRASNLLRVLGQVPEAAALGLLEGQSEGQQQQDTAAKEFALPRRIASLCRFLLDHLYKQGLQHPEQPGSSGSGSPSKSQAPQQQRQKHKDGKQPQREEEAGSPTFDSRQRAPSAFGQELQQLFSMQYRQRMQVFTSPTVDKTRDSRTMLTDLQYPCTRAADSTTSSPVKTPPSTPPGKATPPPSPLPPQLAAAGATSSSSPTGSDQPRPLFAELLERSLLSVNDTRAWVDDAQRYKWVRQSRVPLSCPQVLVVNCAVQSAGDLALWQPLVQEQVVAGGTVQRSERSWLPWCVGIASSPGSWQVEVQQADSVQQLQQLMGQQQQQHQDAAAAGDAAAQPVHALYELTGAVFHIRDEDEEFTAGKKGYEGHLVTMVKIPACYTDSESIYRTSSQQMQGSTPQSARQHSARQPGSAATPSPASPHSQLLPTNLGEVFSSLAAQEVVQPAQQQPGIPQEDQQQSNADASTSSTAAPSTPAKRGSSSSSIGALGLGTPQGKGTAARLGGTPTAAAGKLDWLVLNDFCITPVPAAEVMQTWGNQKLPCLLFYTAVQLPPPEAAAAAAAAAEEELTSPGQQPALACSPPVAAADSDSELARVPVMTAEQFHRLCTAPPVQAPHVQLAPRSFTPLDMASERPRQGMLFAIDAEFVALSAPETMFEYGVEVQTRPARLGLGRVSVLRGEGKRAGSCCIDDYVRAVEPVYDYLTRFSGLVPGDLDPAVSRHHLTSLKAAYLKLRYLLDCGCVFVGHGLKQDFRMLNMVVPPQQIIDTVELFSFRRQRKLSLRFLASYLLGVNIQSSTHDSIEDARTALRLYQVYQQLTSEGTFEAKLNEIYAWGNQHGWEPVTHVSGRPQPAKAAAEGPATGR